MLFKVWWVLELHTRDSIVAAEMERREESKRCYSTMTAARSVTMETLTLPHNAYLTGLIFKLKTTAHCTEYWINLTAPHTAWSMQGLQPQKSKELITTKAWYIYVRGFAYIKMYWYCKSLKGIYSSGSGLCGLWRQISVCHRWGDQGVLSYLRPIPLPICHIAQTVIKINVGVLLIKICSVGYGTGSVTASWCNMHVWWTGVGGAVYSPQP